MKSIEKIINSSKYITFLVLLCAGFALSVQSQVNIGSIAVPPEGLLLDLKQNIVDNGNADSDKGMKFPRVNLIGVTDLNPLRDTNDANVKLSYTGTMVYNVSEISPFEQGLYMWDGTKWISFLTGDGLNINANNGLSFSDDYVQLGGDLIKNTTVALGNNHLIFTRSSGNIGIGTNAAPQSPLHLANTGGGDPLIIQQMKSTSDTKNTNDAANPTYQSLVVRNSDGVIFKIPQTHIVADPNESYQYSLRDNYFPIPQGNVNGTSGGSWITWQGNDGRNSATQYVALPQDGAYVFSFRIYGFYPNIGASDRSDTYYLSAHKGTSTSNNTVVDIAEVVVYYVRPPSGWNSLNHHWSTCTVALFVSGKEGDRIFFKIASANSDAASSGGWSLRATYSGGTAGAGDRADRSSMIFWRL